MRALHAHQCAQLGALDGQLVTQRNQLLHVVVGSDVAGVTADFQLHAGAERGNRLVVSGVALVGADAHRHHREVSVAGDLVGARLQKYLIDVVIVLYHHHRQVAAIGLGDGHGRALSGIDDRTAVVGVAVHAHNGLVVEIKGTGGKVEKSIHPDQLGDVVKRQIALGDLIVIEGYRNLLTGVISMDGSKIWCLAWGGFGRWCLAGLIR